MRSLLLIIIILVTNFPSKGEDTTKLVNHLDKRNAAFVELFGAGLLYSINYERSISIKRGHYINPSLGMQIGFLNHRFQFPIRIPLLFRVNRKLFCNIGGGISVLYDYDYTRTNETKDDFLSGSQGGSVPYIPQFGFNIFLLSGIRWDVNDRFFLQALYYLINPYPYLEIERKIWRNYGGIQIAYRF